MRKIDDNKLLRLFNEEKISQKEIAKHFNVSPPAICKRLKRLLPPPETPSFNELTVKEKKFVLGKVEGKSNIQAVMQSHDVTSKGSAKSMATQLMAKREVQMSITELMEHCGIDKPYRIRRLKNIIDSADLNIAHKGLDTSFKLSGDYASEKHVHEINYQDITRNLKEIEEEIARFEGRTIVDAEFEITENPEDKEHGENKNGR